MSTGIPWLVGREMHIQQGSAGYNDPSSNANTYEYVDRPQKKITIIAQHEQQSLSAL